jgi:hypothetical protein
MLCTAEMTYEHARLCIAINFKTEYWLPPSLFVLTPLQVSFLPPLVSFLPVSLYTVRPLITDAQTGPKKKQYTSTFRNFVPNLPESAILV